MKYSLALLAVALGLFSSCSEEKRHGKVIAIVTASTSDTALKRLFDEQLFYDDVIISVEVKGNAADTAAIDTIDAICGACRYNTQRMPALNTNLTIVNADGTYFVQN